MELDVQGQEIIHFEAVSAAKVAIELDGNTNAKIIYLC